LGLLVVEVVVVFEALPGDLSFLFLPEIEVVPGELLSED